MRKAPLLCLLVLAVLTAQFSSAFIVDPATTMLTGQNITASMRNITQYTMMRNNASFLIVGPGGLNYFATPWYDNGDSTYMRNTGGSDDLHSCYPNPGNVNTVGTAAYVSANLGYSNESFCIVTDELTRSTYDMALWSQNATILNAIVNTIIYLNDSGNTYSGRNGGFLPEWVAYMYYNSTSGRWEISKTNVADTAFDADSYAGLTLKAINVSPYANSADRVAAGKRFAEMCNQSIANEFRTIGSGGLRNRVNPSQNITYIPCGGQNVCNGLGNNQLTYPAYYGPILEYLAACRDVYGDNGGTNYSKYAEDTYQAFLISTNWTGATFRISPGLAHHWVNISVGGTPYAYCTPGSDQGCTSNGDSAGTGTWLGTNWADSLRVVNVCRGAWVWKNFTGRTLENSTTHCAQWASVSGNTETSYCYNYDSTGAVWGGCDSGFRGVGLGMSLFFLNNQSRMINMINQWKSGIAYSSSSGLLRMGSQNSWGVYDKSFGMTDIAYATGIADTIWNGTPPSGGGPPADTQKPSFSTFSCSAVSSTSLTFSFLTDELATATASYNTSKSPLGSSVAEIGAGINHDIVLPGLTANTVYYINVSAVDQSGNVNQTGNASTGQPFNCTTLAAGNDPTNITITGAVVNASNPQQSSPVRFNVTVDDNGGNLIRNVTAEILDPSGSKTNYSMTQSTIPGTGSDALVNQSNFASDATGWSGYQALDTALACLNFTNSQGNVVSPDWGIETSYPTQNVTTIIIMNYTKAWANQTNNNKVYPTQTCSGLSTNNRFNMEQKNSSHWCLKADRNGYSGGGNCWPFNSTVTMNFTTDNTNNQSIGCIQGVGCSSWEPFTRSASSENCVAFEFTNSSTTSAQQIFNVTVIAPGSGSGSTGTDNYYLNYTSTSTLGVYNLTNVYANNSISEVQRNSTNVSFTVGQVCPGSYLGVTKRLICSFTGCAFENSTPPCVYSNPWTTTTKVCVYGSCA